MSETTPLHLSDTGLWHLTVRISADGVGAWVARKEAPEEPPRKLMESRWTPAPDGMMARIENAVYDHPEVLDDYSATIEIRTTRTLVVPKEEAIDPTEAENLYGLVYNGRGEDVMTDANGKETLLFTLCPGMNAFLQRTFPGARVRSHLSMRIEETRSRGTGLRIHLWTRGNEADLVCMNGDNLLSASVQHWKEWSDLAYRIFTLSEVYGFRMEDCTVTFSAPGETAAQLENFLNGKTAGMTAITNNGEDKAI